MMINLLLFIVLVFLTVVIILAVLIWRRLSTKQNQDQAQLESLVAKVFGMSSNQIATQSKAILASEKETIRVDLDNKQQVIEKLITNLQRDLQKRQDEIRNLEQDRIKKFSEISTTLEQQRLLTSELKLSTEQLAAVLSNNQARGEWGERIIEDILQTHGLIEGIHYLRQTFLTDSNLKPDITLILPNHRFVAVDVKFPYQEMQKMLQADTKAVKAAHLKQFGLDLKIKISKVALYIAPEHGTLDYAIMFVPNEMIFSFINQKFPALVDEAIGKKVLIVSPFTFLIVSRTVMESYRNFLIGDKLKEVVVYLDDFAKEWLLFKDEFSKFGRSIETLRTGYEKITTTRTNQMEKKLTKIQQYRGGNLIEAKSLIDV